MDIIIDKLEKSYWIGLNENIVLENICLKISTGEFVFITGPSGSGKTTLLNIIVGFSKQNQGKIDLIKDNKITKKATFPNNLFGIIFQDAYLFENLTVYDNIRIAIKSSLNLNEINQKIEAITQDFQIDDLQNKIVKELSGGQKQRVTIARALVSNPSVIIGDEITANLDESLSHEIINVLKTYQGKNPQTTIILATHDLSLLQKGSRVIELQDKNVIKDSTI